MSNNNFSSDEKLNTQLENERKKLREDREKIKKDREKIREEIRKAETRKAEILSEIASKRKNAKKKSKEIKIKNKLNDTALKMDLENDKSNDKVEIALQRKIIKNKSNDIKEFKRILKKKSKLYNFEFKNEKKNNSKLRREKILSLETSINEQQKKIKNEIERVKIEAKTEIAYFLENRQQKKAKLNKVVEEFKGKAEIEKLRVKEAKLKLKNIKSEIKLREGIKKRKTEIIKKDQRKNTDRNKIQQKWLLKLSKILIKIKRARKDAEEDNYKESSKNTKNIKNRKSEIKKIKKQTLEKIKKIKSEDNHNEFIDNFVSAFSEKNVFEEENEEIFGSVVSSFGKKYVKRFKSVQLPSIEVDAQRFKKDSIASESIYNFRNNSLKAIKIKSLFGYIEIILNKHFSKEEVDRFHIQMITALLSDHSIKFANGFLSPIINRKKITIEFVRQLNDRSNLVEFLDEEIGNALNELINEKLDSGVSILLANGLLATKKDCEIKIFEDTNFIKGR